MNAPVSFINQYLLLEMVHRGDASELFRAIEIAEKGFKRSVILKRYFQWVTDEFEPVMEDYFFRLESYYPQNNSFFIKNIEWGKSRNLFFQVREFVRGKPLDKVIHGGRIRNKPLSVELAVFIACQICLGILTLEDFPAGSPAWIKFHGALNPVNVLISYEGEIKLLNYGLTWLESIYDRRASLSRNLFLPYCSPEKAAGQKLDIRADIFSIGTLLFEMLTGQKLFGPNVREGQLIPGTTVSMGVMKTLRGKIPRQLEDILVKTVTVEPTERYQSVRDLLRDCTSLIDLEKRRDFTIRLKEYITDVFADDMKAERQKINDEKEKYATLLGLNLDGEDKFLEPTDMVRVEQKTTPRVRPVPSPRQAAETGQPKQEQSPSSPGSIDIVYPDSPLTDQDDGEISPQEVENYLDKAIKDLLQQSQQKSETSSPVKKEDSFAEEWEAIDYEIERQQYAVALQKLNQLKKDHPDREDIQDKIGEVRKLLLHNKGSFGDAAFSQEHTQPMGGIKDGARKDKSADADFRESAKKSFSLLNAVLWLLLIIFSLLLVLVLTSK